MRWHIGTMGLSYTDWHSNFYPEGTRPGEFLSAYACAFDTVELDTTFHAVPPVERVKKWCESVPEGFTFCVKTPRAVTHDGPLAIGMPLMRQFLAALAPMREAGQLGVVLIQFPPAFTASELPEVRRFLKELPGGVRFAMEFRNSSWEREETGEILAEYGCCWVTGDYGVDPYPIHGTTDFLYLRLIGIHEQFAKHDMERIDMTDRLAWWLEQVGEVTERIKKVFVMVNNDYAGHGPSTVNRLRGLVGLGKRMPPRKEEAQRSLF